MSTDRLQLVLRKITRRLNWWAIYYEYGKEPDPLCILAGYTRSGTTLLGRMLANLYRCRPVHEPLNPKSSPNVEYFHERESLQLIKTSLRHQQAIKAVFGKKFRGTRFTNIGTRVLYRGRLIKIVRANHYLGYLSDLYAKTPFVFIMRNPVDCVRSRIRLGWDVPDFRHCFDELSVSLTPSQRDVCKAAQSKVEMLAVSWCLDNYLALQNRHNAMFLYTQYETLVRDSRRELNRISRHVDKPIGVGDLERELRFERLPHVYKGIQDHAELGEEDRERIWDIVSWFDLDKYYNKSSGLPTNIEPFC